MLWFKKLLKKVLPKSVVDWLRSSREKGRFYTWRIVWFIRQKLLPHRYVTDPYLACEIYFINPAMVSYTTIAEFNYFRDHNKVVGGDWDLPLRGFEEDLFFESYKELVRGNKQWSDTPYYRHHLEDILNGEEMWGCRSKDEWDQRCELLDALYSDIKEIGYQPQKIEDYISVNIDRHGHLLFNDGRHRLTFCKLLEVPEIPIRITVRHSKWVMFKNQIYEYAASRRGKVYAPITHIDLQSVPSLYGHQRFDLIRQHLTPPYRGTVLDIGAHWGYFSHRFEQLGFDCLAVENDPVNLFFLNKLRTAEERNFAVFDQSIFSLDIERSRYDAVLALAVFHHFTKEGKRYDLLTRFLQKLDMQEMYFEPPDPSEPQMQTAYRNYDCKGFVDYILDNSCLTHYKLIGQAEDSRKLYKLWRN